MKYYRNYYAGLGVYEYYKSRDNKAYQYYNRRLEWVTPVSPMWPKEGAQEITGLFVRLQGLPL